MKKLIITISAVLMLGLTACSAQATNAEGIDSLKTAFTKVHAEAVKSKVEKSFVETVRNAKAEELKKSIAALEKKVMLEKVKQSFEYAKKSSQLEAIETLVDSFNSAI